MVVSHISAKPDLTCTEFTVQKSRASQCKFIALKTRTRKISVICSEGRKSVCGAIFLGPTLSLFQKTKAGSLTNS